MLVSPTAKYLTATDMVHNAASSWGKFWKQGISVREVLNHFGFGTKWPEAGPFVEKSHSMTWLVAPKVFGATNQVITPRSAQSGTADIQHYSLQYRPASQLRHRAAVAGGPPNENQLRLRWRRTGLRPR
ncbi:hypothetical protein [Streptomyces sp. XY431]|uniref:hypothetical protein n=1 Tax=Streptomyces sp. XY431 TaxID=1415562 RepID=UPI000A89E7F8|nr:hypothetical protein [Streptomyces sp. XY431]